MRLEHCLLSLVSLSIDMGETMSHGSRPPWGALCLLEVGCLRMNIVGEAPSGPASLVAMILVDDRTWINLCVNTNHIVMIVVLLMLVIRV